MTARSIWLNISRPFKWIVLWAIVITIAQIFFPVLYSIFLQPTVRGWSLRHSLLSEIDHAKQIQVIEHSCKWDNFVPSGDKLKPAWKEHIYATVTLNPDQISKLRTALSPAHDYSGSTFTACIFEPHHRIEIRQPDSSVYSIEICLICGELELNGAHQRILPEGWKPRLAQFISSLSLHPDGPWIAQGN